MHHKKCKNGGFRAFSLKQNVVIVRCEIIIIEIKPGINSKKRKTKMCKPQKVQNQNKKRKDERDKCQVHPY